MQSPPHGLKSAFAVEALGTDTEEVILRRPSDAGLYSWHAWLNAAAAVVC
jgi:hypothetical protein